MTGIFSDETKKQIMEDIKALVDEGIAMAEVIIRIDDRRFEVFDIQYQEGIFEIDMRKEDINDPEAYDLRPRPLTFEHWC